LGDPLRDGRTKNAQLFGWAATHRNMNDLIFLGRLRVNDFNVVNCFCSVGIRLVTSSLEFGRHFEATRGFPVSLPGRRDQPLTAAASGTSRARAKSFDQGPVFRRGASVASRKPMPKSRAALDQSRNPGETDKSELYGGK